MTELRKYNKTEMAAHVEGCFAAYEMTSVMEGMELAVPAALVTFSAQTPDLAFAKVAELLAKEFTVPSHGVQTTTQPSGFTTFTLRRPQAEIDADKAGLWKLKAEADYKAAIDRHNAKVQKEADEAAAIAQEKERLIAEFYAEMERQAEENVKRGSRSPMFQKAVCQ